jgi:hypothetical protein
LQGWPASSRPGTRSAGAVIPSARKKPGFSPSGASIAQQCVHDPAARSVRVLPFFSRPLSKRATVVEVDRRSTGLKAGARAPAFGG